MIPKKPIAISLFSGAGGMDIGVSQAGFNIISCIENDPNCCETLREAKRIFQLKAKIIEADIREIEPKTLMEELGLKPGNLDLLFGGPPCQSFSQIGKQKGINEERGLLLFQMIRFAQIFQPKAIFIEQVKGLLSSRGEKGEKGEVFRKLITDLEELDYVPKWQVINAADYGIPQIRKRIFVVATKKPNGFQFPIPTHCPNEKPLTLFPQTPYVTVGDVIKELGRPSKKNGAGRENSHIDVTPEGDRIRIHGVPEGSYLAAQSHLPKSQVKNLTKKDTTKFLRLARNKTANTLRCGEIFFHPTQDRYLTPSEYLRIHGFPDNFVLKGPIRGRSGSVRNLDQHRQVANSVPPPVAKLIAKEIIKTLLCRKSLKPLVFH